MRDQVLVQVPLAPERSQEVEGAGVFSHGDEYSSLREAGVRERRIQFQGVLNLLQGLRVAIRKMQDVRQVQVGLGVDRVDGDERLGLADGFLEAALGGQQPRIALTSPGIAGVRRDGPQQHVFSVGEFPVGCHLHRRRSEGLRSASGIGSRSDESLRLPNERPLWPYGTKSKVMLLRSKGSREVNCW